MGIHRIYSPFLIYFRRQRLEFLYKLFSINESTNLLDVGGDLFFWELAKNIGFPSPESKLSPIARVPRVSKHFYMQLK